MRKAAVASGQASSAKVSALVTMGGISVGAGCKLATERRAEAETRTFASGPMSAAAAISSDLVSSPHQDPSDTRLGSACSFNKRERGAVCSFEGAAVGDR